MNTSPTIVDHPEQLALLPAAPVPVQFRLSQATRQLGLAHIAAIRARLEQSSQTRAVGSGRRAA